MSLNYNIPSKNNLYLPKTLMASRPASTTKMPTTSVGSSSRSSAEAQPQRPQSIKDIVLREVMSDERDALLKRYKNNEHDVQTLSITRSKETVLHMAVSNNNTELALELVLILADPNKIKMMKNDRDNNPLHLAASLGQKEMCEALVARDVELVRSRNKDGETPLFLAALHGKKEAFSILHQKSDDISHCKRNIDGNSILHVTIQGEYFELAFQILKLYPQLSNFKNERGQSALQILATKPSAFRSGCHFGPFGNFIYLCLIVEEMEDKKERNSEESTAQQNQNSKETRVFSRATWKSCWRKTDIETPQPKQTSEKPEEVKKPIHIYKDIMILRNPGRLLKMFWEALGTEALEEKSFILSTLYVLFTLLEFGLELLKFICGLGCQKVFTIKEKKQKHTQSFQLMKKLVSNANSWEAEDAGSKPLDDSIRDFQHEELIKMMTPPDESSSADSTHEKEKDAKDAHNVAKGTRTLTIAKMMTMTIGEIQNIISNQMKLKKIQVEPEKARPDVYNLQMFSMDSQKDGMTEKSPFLVAAEMGVTEMVEEILKIFPVAIHDVNRENKNAVLLAVENRQSDVYLCLKKRYSKMENIMQKVDSRGNSALHLAANFTQSSPWLIPGAALQMQWDLKWYKLIKKSIPSHFLALRNDEKRTSEDVLTETHGELANNATKWISNVSKSCSIIATLIATVAFTSATSLPGGVYDSSGTPRFVKNAFYIMFSFASLLALCASVTSLTMFLSVLSSRFQVWDFHLSLPLKLILGLGSLFASIALILIAFCCAHFLAVWTKIRYFVIPLYAGPCLPLALFVVAYAPLYLDLIRTVLAPMPKRSFEATFI